MADIDLRQLTAKILFDYVGPAFPEWWKKNKKFFELPDLRGINSEQVKGGKYFMQLKLSYKGQIFELPNEPLISIGLAKTIVKTATVGKQRKGSVKEYICTEDSTITIKGVCVNVEEPELYPAEQVALLKELFDINDALEVESNAFFELFGVRKLVIEDMKFDEMVGESGLQSYTISAVDDQDFYADLNEKDTQKNNLLG
ncbi:DUF6046 domain-containing protein [Flavobacterium covae]|uniref:DUF6046 domain-containing protein n=1 Tax=Flavobacterium covae TaxID=2906076 RepID=UPI000745EDB5|nr:DUF6046 domain-containing protein [Flavobacterium covae]AMA48992.1 hypothetical protein AWN65_05695 [Flavobacterium covae]MCJ1809911.1 DUF6046 domain-containing protein [Flavobacterium covae]